MQISRENASACKAAAILMIILSHAVGTFGSGSVRIFTPFGGIGVAIFLLLSGYGLNESWRAGERGEGRPPWAAWWRKRLSTVLPLYWIVQLLCCWIVQRVSLSQLLLDLLLVQPLHPHGWYLNYLMLWYLAFYCLKRIRPLARYSVALAFLFGAVLFFVQAPIRAEQALSFPVGMLLSEKKGLIRRERALLSGALLVLVGGLFLGLKQLPALRAAPELVMNCVQLLIKLPCGLGIAVLATGLLSDRSCRPLGVVGSMSFELYLAHGYLLQWAPRSPLGVLLFLAGTTVFAAALWFLNKKTKPLVRKALRIDA